MATMPTIDSCFAVYLQSQFSNGTDPITESDQRRPFFCGFIACFKAFDTLAQITYEDLDQGDNAWQTLQAEFDQYAQQELEGDHSINH